MNKKILDEDIKNIKVIQAPLAGISDKVFRGLIRHHGSKCLMTTEMLSSEMLCNLMFFYAMPGLSTRLSPIVIA